MFVSIDTFNVAAAIRSLQLICFGHNLNTCYMQDQKKKNSAMKSTSLTQLEPAERTRPAQKASETGNSRT